MLRLMDQQGFSIAEETSQAISRSDSKSRSEVSEKSKHTLKSVQSKGRTLENQSVSTIGTEKKKHIILDEGKSGRLTGKLKFFDEAKSYGFITLDSTGKDIFVHLGDLQKAGVTVENLRDPKIWKNYKFEFSAVTYIGRHNKSQKAVDLAILK